MKKYTKKNIITILIAAAVMLQCTVSNVYAEQVVSTKKNDKEIILIDPGHGGIDGGASSKGGTLEKDINLKISLKLKKLLLKDGYVVKMTREEDKGLYEEKGTIRKKKLEDLKNRCKMRKESKCDMFMSIHLNMFPERKYYGSQVWYADNAESSKIAHILQENLRDDLKDDSGRIEKPALNLYKVLRNVGNTPAVIVECGFLSNYNEEQKLKSDSYQDKIAESLLKSIKMYYNNQK
ncbi:MAG: N-acetylmuramoyl-L-alanine amidase CwlD [Clostridium sp.]|nr:N-acetylmuramoyl-L-alanine amidase CwlD [Clostridium sp.]